jgi:hypothetical protein
MAEGLCNPPERHKGRIAGESELEVSERVDDEVAEFECRHVARRAAYRPHFLPTPGQTPATATTQAAAAQAVSVPLRITLAPAVAGNAEDAAPLFVSARLPGQRMPLAAKRLEARFPQDVELLSTDAVMGGSGFAAGQEIEVEARIANGGSANSRSGDPFGMVTLKAGSGERITIQINQLKP